MRKNHVDSYTYPTVSIYEFLQDKKLTNALLDRLVPHSKFIFINGKPYRMKYYSEKETKTQKSK